MVFVLWLLPFNAKLKLYDFRVLLWEIVSFWCCHFSVLKTVQKLCLKTFWLFNLTEWMARNWSAAEPWLGSLCNSSSWATHYALQKAIELSAAAGQPGPAGHAGQMMILASWKSKIGVQLSYIGFLLSVITCCGILFSREFDFRLQTPCFLMFVGVLLVYT